MRQALLVPVASPTSLYGTTRQIPCMSQQLDDRITYLARQHVERVQPGSVPVLGLFLVHRGRKHQEIAVHAKQGDALQTRAFRRIHAQRDRKGVLRPHSGIACQLSEKITQTGGPRQAVQRLRVAVDHRTVEADDEHGLVDVIEELQCGLFHFASPAACASCFNTISPSCFN